MKKRWIRRLGLSRVDLAVAGALILVGGMIVCSIRSDSIMRARTLEAANFLSEVHRCQERYFEERGQYADSLAQLDLRLPPPTKFDLKPLVADDRGWSLIAVQQGTGVTAPTVLSMDHRGWFDRDKQQVRRGLKVSALALSSEAPVSN